MGFSFSLFGEFLGLAVLFPEVVAQRFGELDLFNPVRRREGRTDRLESGLVVHRRQIGESFGGPRRKAGRNEGLPCGNLFVMGIQRHHADNKTHGFEERAGPAGMVGEKFGFFVREDVGIRAVVGVFGSVEFFANRKPAESISLRAAGRTNLEIPELENK